MKFRKSQLVILIFLLPLISASKDTCIGFYECGLCRPQNAKGFEMHGLSKSAVLEVGIPSSFDIELYGGKDFIVSSCAERSFYPIHMRLFDGNNQMLYDNQIDDYNESIGFSLDETQTITVEVTVLAEGINPENFDENRSCAGVLILWRNTPKIGF